MQRAIPRRTISGLAILIGVIGLAQALTLVGSPWEADDRAEVLEEGSTVDFDGEPWDVRYDGFGEVSFLTGGDCSVFDLEPKTAADPDTTHAALVRSTDEDTSVDLDVEMRTLEQLRPDDPNAWESAWLLWHVTGDQSFYYFALKTNGWELGKADAQYPGAQRFLTSGDSPAVELGEWARIEVEQDGPAMTVRVDGVEVTSFTDEERPLAGGAVGFYTEDAKVQFRPSECASGA